MKSFELQLKKFSFLCLTLMLFVGDGFSENYSIVFVHVGDNVPNYAKTALTQARDFNPDCSIILVADQAAIGKICNDFDMIDASITFVACESLNKSEEHKRFIKETTLDGSWREGFWRYTSERFLYLADLMNDYQLTNVFHMEYDNMLYVNLAELLPIFKERYSGIGATFDNDDRCIPGFLYFNNYNASTSLAQCFAKHVKRGFNDMEVLATYRKEQDLTSIDSLPIVHLNYVIANPLMSTMGHRTKRKFEYCKNIDAFDSIFDAAAIGQYLGGIDPRNGHSEPGFINESCLFNPSRLNFTWDQDNEGRWIPYASYNGEKRRINNLHIHCKNLSLFLSRKEQTSKNLISLH